MARRASTRPPLAHRASYLFVPAALALVMAYHLGFALLAGLFSFTVLDLAGKWYGRFLRPLTARWLALATFVGAAAAASWGTWHLIRQTLLAVPALTATALPRAIALAASYGIDLPFENLEDLRAMVVDWVSSNAGRITAASSLLSQEFLRILIAVFVAILCFLAAGHDAYGPSLYDALRRDVGGRIRRFMRSVELVLGAQVLISAINTTLTAIFLLTLDFPYVAFLIPATFVLGLMPIVGNLVSNTLILATGLTLSVRAAGLALAYLVIIHKAEYFLNSRIIGSSIRAPMWQTLLGILVGEIVLGIPGIILAPALLHYARQELSDVRAAR